MDKILHGFLQKQREEGIALAAESDLFTLRPLPFDVAAPDHYLATFGCRGLVRRDDGEIVESEGFEVGFRFPSSYLREANSFEVVAMFTPNVWHPNVRAPFVCIGRMTPGTPLVDLVYQVHEILSWQKVTMREDDALNPDACAWARQNGERYPLDSRPLKRRALEFGVEEIGGAEGDAA